MCHRSRSVSTPTAPRHTPRDADLRASQSERERTVDALRDHAGEGRLDVDELETRLDAALTAKTRGDLRELTMDLPRASTGTPRPRALGVAAGSVAQLLIGIAIIVAAPAALAWIGWTLVGFWFFGGDHLHRRHRHRETALG